MKIGNEPYTCESEPQPMVCVHHACHSIKTVPVELVLVHPPAGVGQQEAHGLPIACRKGWAGIADPEQYKFTPKGTQCITASTVTESHHS